METLYRILLAPWQLLLCSGADSGRMAMSKASTGDIILQGGRKVDLRDRSLSSLDVASLAKLISTSTIVEALSLYNVRLSSDVSATRTTALTSLEQSRQSFTLPHCCCCYITELRGTKLPGDALCTVSFVQFNCVFVHSTCILKMTVKQPQYNSY